MMQHGMIEISERVLDIFHYANNKCTNHIIEHIILQNILLITNKAHCVKNLHINVYETFTQNVQTLEVRKMSFSRRMVKHYPDIEEMIPGKKAHEFFFLSINKYLTFLFFFFADFVELYSSLSSPPFCTLLFNSFQIFPGS